MIKSCVFMLFSMASNMLLADDAATLQAQNKLLQSTIERLNKENTALKAEVIALRRELSDLREGHGSPAIGATRPTPAAGPATQTAAVDTPRQKPTSRPTPLTLAEVMKTVPENAKPHFRQGWDEFSSEAMRKWLVSELSGREIETHVTIDSVGITPNRGGSTGDWLVQLRVEDERAVFVGKCFLVSYNARRSYGFSLACDEATARRLKQVPPGGKILLKGTVQLVEWHVSLGSAGGTPSSPARLSIMFGAVALAPR
jgi:hypothetical protein